MTDTLNLQKNLYRVADLTVEMNTFGRTLVQAQPYRTDDSAQADIVICSAWQELHKNQPHLSPEDCEYLTTGWSFYNQLLDFDGMMLHASAVVMDGRAYLFSAPCGTGKSTHTSIWQRVFGDKVIMLNDDKPALRRIDGTWYAYGTPWSGKYDYNTNMRAPIAGICLLVRGTVNKIAPFGGVPAVCALMEQTSRSRNGGPNWAKIAAQLDVLMRDVPVWLMECNMDDEAAILSHKVMSGKAE